MNGVTQMSETEHGEHELDPSLTRTGRYKNNSFNKLTLIFCCY
jgi:hypothetical protein